MNRSRSPTASSNRLRASLGGRPSWSSISLVIPVRRSLAALQAFPDSVHFASARMRQDPEATEPSSRTIAQPISMGESWRCQTRRLKLNEGYSLKSVTALDGARVIHFQKPARPRGDRKVGTYIEAGPYPSIQTLRRSVGRDAWHSIREGQATRSLCHFAMLWSFDQETAVCAYEPPLRPKSCTYPNSYELEKSSESGYLFIVYEFFKEKRLSASKIYHYALYLVSKPRNKFRWTLKI